MASLCTYCEQGIDEDDPLTWIEVVVWVHGPKKDGAKLRRATGKVMHPQCMVRFETGVSPDMEPMF